MIDIDTIEREILDLEKHDTTYATIERLAWLYTVRDHMMKTETNARTGRFVGDDFSSVCSDVPIDSLVNIIAEHMEAIRVVYPREYDAIIQKISKL